MLVEKRLSDREKIESRAEQMKSLFIEFIKELFKEIKRFEISKSKFELFNFDKILINVETNLVEEIKTPSW
ncbi:hypothetical protein O9G_002663 [Rozella allomycis CSF55]|uniref:Uncharacterized protein n=1 Tax=Rozella allomycis (strain CSF55) TaxID=988480 RepID=A0A075B449_ROZAC|nr:hypothetical protein O9G_002663 [Rozella allomycis CSF55]|eukprot:EPZ36020.1 hypothetical protein O9G_002663 [Rozella allomycis CSF55]